MASLLESQLRQKVATAFKGKLLTGTLRRETPGAVNSYGDATVGTTADYSFDGIVENYSAFYRAQAGIPDTDVKILIIGGSLAVTPVKDDKVKIRGIWYQLRSVATDPALASHTCQAFEIEAP